MGYEVYESKFVIKGSYQMLYMQLVLIILPSPSQRKYLTSTLSFKYSSINSYM